MCGIFGLIGVREKESYRALDRGVLALSHRGPDDDGSVWLPVRSEPGRSVGLGSRRLAILDLSPAGHMPMHDPVRDNWLVYNGEIYNYLDLRRELERAGHQFSSTGDTEVLLKAYGEWGADCVKHLRGMFAFAVWDVGRQKLMLARDHLGVKPLYYYHSGRQFVFASEVRAMLDSGLVPRRLQRAGMVSYLEFGAVQDPLTAIEGVSSVLPGEALDWREGRIERRQYWSLADVARRRPAHESFEEAVKALKPMLLEAVSRQLVSDVPLGLFLSGGVDSSAVAALAREVKSEPLDTFSVVFSERDFDESSYSDEVAATLGTRHHRIELSENDLLAELPNVSEAMDQPTIDGANTYIVSHGVKKAGITVALSGLGGDELFAGYSTFRSMPRLLAFKRALDAAAPLARSFGWGSHPLQTNRLSKGLALLRSDYPGHNPYFLLRSLFLPSGVGALLGANGLAEHNGHFLDPLDSLRKLELVNQVSVLEASTYMRSTLLRDADVMSMRHSLEVRVPFVDHVLWEQVLPLRGRLKLDSGLPKPLLLKSLPRPLPERSYRRRKKGFLLPFEEWMRGALRPSVEQELSRPIFREHWPLDPAAVGAVWDAFLRGRTTWSRPWSLFVLKQWIRQNRCEFGDVSREAVQPEDSVVLA